MPNRPSDGKTLPDNREKARKKRKIAAVSAGCLLLTGALLVFGVDQYVARTGARHIITPDEAAGLTDVDTSAAEVTRQEAGDFRQRPSIRSPISVFETTTTPSRETS